MKKLVILLLISLLLYGLDRLGWLSQPKEILEGAFSFRIALPASPSLGGPQNQDFQKLKEENLELLSRITEQKSLIAENEALRIQLGAPKKSGQKFLPARVLGINSNFLIIDKGKADNLQANQIAVYKNILVGKVVSLSENRSRVELPTALGSKTPAKTERGALGVVVGTGGGRMLLSEVTLSEKLESKDLVFTIPPDFLIGEVKKIFKSESALFQQAEIESPLDFKRLETIFLLL